MLKQTVVPFTAGDGMALNLIHVEGEKSPDKGPVLLVHGAGVRANIYRAPVKTTIVEFLVEHGYDVWLENWRASIDLAPTMWNLDEAAIYDHPQAVKKVIEETGAEKISAVIHCQGSTSFMMSAVAGLVPEVKTIISNAVSLHPNVVPFSVFKLNWAVPFVSLFIHHLNPRWGLEAPWFWPKLLNAVVKLTHHECDNPVCKQVSFTYGTGWPALWNHENLNDETHDEWLNHEFGFVPMRFFAQMKRCVKAGHLVSDSVGTVLPNSFVDEPPKTDARIAFYAGKDNLCFTPESQVETFNYFDSIKQNFHSLHLLDNYGHLDVFMGENAAEDVFPSMLAELNK